MRMLTKLISITLLAGGFAGTAMAADVSLRLGHVGAPVSPQETIAGLFSEKVKEYSDGSVSVQVFNSSTLGNERHHRHDDCRDVFLLRAVGRSAGIADALFQPRALHQVLHQR